MTVLEKADILKLSRLCSVLLNIFLKHFLNFGVLKIGMLTRFFLATVIFSIHESINEGVDSHREFAEDSCNKSGGEGNNIKINSYQVTCAGGD